MNGRDGAFDLVIAGAGPAGLATAIRARLAGLDAIVLERRRTLDKACGEGIMPAGTAALAEMGVRFAEGDGSPFLGIRYVEGDRVAEGRFAGPPGLGVRRTVLARQLLSRARELGAVVDTARPLEGWTVEGNVVRVRTPAGDVRGSLLVGADGLHSRVRQLAGLRRIRPRRHPAPRRFGVRRHFAIAPWSDLVEVHLADGAEAYVTPVAPDLVGVAVLFSPSRPTPGYESLLSRFPTLRERLAGAGPVDRARGAGPLRQPVRGRIADRVALVGDAAGYLDALTGQGIEIGLEAARLLVDTVRAGHGLERYDASVRRLVRRYRIGAELLLRVTRSRIGRRGLVGLLRASPALFDRAVTAL